jgi:hypothetical protein
MSFFVEFQSNYFRSHKVLIIFFGGIAKGLCVSGFLLRSDKMRIIMGNLRCVDPDITDMPSVAENDGIAINNPFYTDPLLRRRRCAGDKKD